MVPYNNGQYLDVGKYVSAAAPESGAVAGTTYGQAIVVTDSVLRTKIGTNTQTGFKESNYNFTQSSELNVGAKAITIDITFIFVIIIFSLNTNYHEFLFQSFIFITSKSYK